MKEQTEYFYPNYRSVLFPVGLGGYRGGVWAPQRSNLLREAPGGSQKPFWTLPNVFQTKKNQTKPFCRVVVHPQRSHSTKFEGPNVFWVAWAPLQSSTSTYLNFNFNFNCNFNLNFNLQDELQFHFWHFYWRKKYVFYLTHPPGPLNHVFGVKLAIFARDPVEGPREAPGGSQAVLERVNPLNDSLGSSRRPLGHL